MISQEQAAADDRLFKRAMAHDAAWLSHELGGATMVAVMCFNWRWFEWIGLGGNDPLQDEDIPQPLNDNEKRD